MTCYRSKTLYHTDIWKRLTCLLYIVTQGVLQLYKTDFVWWSMEVTHKELTFIKPAVGTVLSWFAHFLLQENLCCLMMLHEGSRTDENILHFAYL